jgi:hypothetical protein
MVMQLQSKTYKWRFDQGGKGGTGLVKKYLLAIPIAIKP